LNEADLHLERILRQYTPPKRRQRGKRDKPLMLQDSFDRLQSQVAFLTEKVKILNSEIYELDNECNELAYKNIDLNKKLENLERLPKTWRKYPDSDGWKEACALDVEVALGIFNICPLDGDTIHPRCMNLFDGVCKSPTGLCSSAKQHIK
jgi:hypothetical protein